MKASASMIYSSLAAGNDGPCSAGGSLFVDGVPPLLTFIAALAGYTAEKLIPNNDIFG